jgi:hypothetical protein
MAPDPLNLLKKLLRVAAVDQGRAFSATWTKSRLRTLLMDECFQRGLQLAQDKAMVQAEPLSRVHGFAGQRVKPAERQTPDLVVQDAQGRKLLTVDVLCGSSQGSEPLFTPEAVYTSIVRLTKGVVDAVMISTDIDDYNRLHVADTALQGTDALRIRLFTAVLPPPGEVSVRNPRLITLDDSTLTVFGARTTAFATGRVVCALCQHG